MFWKKKDKKESTNPFDSDSTPSSPAPSYHSSPAPSYQQQQDTQPSRYGGGSRYNTEDQRNELMAGARNDSGGYNSRDGNNYGRRGYPTEENDYGRGGSRGGDMYGDEQDDEDVQVAGMKQQIKNIKQDSLASTRLALQKIHETEQTAANTMNMLGQQSSKCL